MNRCPLTYDPCEGLYAKSGLKGLARGLTELHRLPFSSRELRQEAAARADKISIQGVQPKLSAQLEARAGRFVLVDRGGRYILKPQVADYPQIPQNEDLTMRAAALAGIDVPFHGLLHCQGSELAYVIRRFDRLGRGRKVHVEDFAVLSRLGRDAKYDSSMERVAAILDEFCTFPAVEKVKLFRRCLFAFLVGNEDLHLKNLSLLHGPRVIALSPAYDLLNTTILLPGSREELALPLNGRKNNLRRRDLVDYFGRHRLALPDRVIDRVLGELARGAAALPALLERSFLSPPLRKRYLAVVEERRKRLFSDGGRES